MNCEAMFLNLMIITILLGIGGTALADEMPPMPKLKTFYTEVPIARGGEPSCIIAVPSGDEYAAIGQEIAAAIKKASGANIPVMDAAAMSIDELGKSNMILVGYFANNPLVNRIYDEHYVALDVEWPGSGGYVIRTVHDPMGKGTCFVYLGGADMKSVRNAVDDFISTLPEKGDISYPHTVKVVASNGSLMYKPDPDGIAKRVEDARGKNFRAMADIVTSAAVDYYLYGNPDRLEVFRQTMPMLRDIVKKMDKVTDARGAFYLFNMWDVVEESPQFSNQERSEITQFVWEFANKFTDAHKPPEKLKAPVGNDWDSRVAWDMARYFKKYYDLDVAGLWAWSEARFQGKAKFWRSVEDCPGYGGMTMYDTLYYALPAQYDEFFTSGMARKMGDYGIAITNNLGGMAGFGDTSSMGDIGYWANLFQVCAWKYKDGRYIYAFERTPGLSRGNFCYNTYLQDQIKPVLPADLLGIHVIPLPDWEYDMSVKEGVTLPPREECFDKITFRTSFEREDQYLILGGISLGYHAHPDGNSIIEYTDNDRYCIFDSGYFVPDTIEHNTLVVYSGGLFKDLPRLTGLSAMADFSDVGMTQTYLNDYNGINWRRNIIWKKEEFFLVIDEVEALETSEYGLNAVFRTLADQKPKPEADRSTAVYKGKAFNIVSASHNSFKVTTTTPLASNRHAIIESKSARMQAGDREYFINLLYAPGETGVWPYEIVPAGKGAAMVKSPKGYALAGTGKCEPVPQMLVDAAIFYITQDGFALADALEMKAGPIHFVSDKPISIEADMIAGEGTIEAKEDAVIKLYAESDDIWLDGELAESRWTTDGYELKLPKGKHKLSFPSLGTGIGVVWWEKAYGNLEKAHKAELAKLTTGEKEGRELDSAWRVENAKTVSQSLYVNKKGEAAENLTRVGKPMCWTDAQKGADPRSAVDGDPVTYTAVGSDASWSDDLPKDLGMEWGELMTVGCFQIDYHSAGYEPAADGHKLQAWDGENWYPIEAEVEIDESGLNWTYSFPPIETTRIRVFITKFNPSRTAIREMRIFSEPVKPEQRDLRSPYETRGLAAMDIDGDGKAEVISVAGPSVKCIKSGGEVVWEKVLDKDALCVDAYDLDGDGRGEIVVGGSDHKLYCFDYKGNELWSVLTSADPYFPEIEPATGMIRVVKCADIDGDGEGEIIIGSSNWFAYCYDRRGEKVWGSLNWAHQPTSIAFVDLGGGKLGSFIGTTYNDANLFDADGKRIAGVSVGYHGAAMCTAAGDMDGNGKVELIAGSRVGGLHCKEMGSRRAWGKSMGAEVSRVALADLNGDGKLELIAASKNFHILVTDVEGTVLWSRNVGESIVDLAVADVDGDGKPELVVGMEGGMLRVIDAKGYILGTFTCGDNVTRVIAADIDGDGKIELVAGSSDGFTYGDIK